MMKQELEDRLKSFVHSYLEIKHFLSTSRMKVDHLKRTSKPINRNSMKRKPSSTTSENPATEPNKRSTTSRPN